MTKLILFTTLLLLVGCAGIPTERRALFHWQGKPIYDVYDCTYLKKSGDLQYDRENADWCRTKFTIHSILN